VKPEALKLIADLNKQFGAGTVVLASQVKTIGRMTTGSLALDVILGGGWPVNQWVELIGDPSHGKTTIALKTIAANQERDPEFTAAWVAAEAWSKSLAQMCGVDVDRVILIESNVMEDAYEAAIKFAESRTVDMLVIDSLPALVPHTEDEKAMEESTVGRSALLTNKFFRKVGKATKRDLVDEDRPFLGIMINQWRMKIGVMHGDPRTSPGGMGKDFAYAVRCEVRRDEWIEVGTGNAKTRVGQGTRIRTIKNKTAPPQRVAYVDFYFDEGGAITPGDYDYAKEIVSLGVVYNLIERRGAWFYYGTDQWQGAAKLLDSIREDVVLKERLEKDVLAVAMRALNADEST